MGMQMMMTYIMVDVFAIIMSFTMGFFIDSDFGNELEVKELRKSILCFSGFLICGIIWLLIIHGYVSYNLILVWVSNMLSLLFMTLTTYHWCIFALSKLSIGHSFPSRRQLRLFQIPLVIAAFVLAVSPWTGWAFTITSDGKYVRGPLFAYISGLEFLYSIIVCVRACVSYRKEKNLEKRNFL